MTKPREKKREVSYEEKGNLGPRGAEEREAFETGQRKVDRGPLRAED